MNTVAHAAHRATGLFRWITAIPLRVALARRERALASIAASGPSVRERQADLIHFYAHYETLVEALCDAAQYGATEPLERRYRSSREWMHIHYPKMRMYAVAFLRFDPTDALDCAELDGTLGDAFEALFAAPTLEAFLAADDGNMISRIMRTREALNLYGEHLRQLLIREPSCA